MPLELIFAMLLAVSVHLWLSFAVFTYFMDRYARRDESCSALVELVRFVTNLITWPISLGRSLTRE